MQPPVQATTRAHAPNDVRFPYMPGLDGLRAIAVLAVFFYHAGVDLRGGFLGVETFFALSGFLITALLLAEWRQHGRIDLAGFWARRARRLLPALMLLIGGVLLLAQLLPQDERRGLGGDILAALGYIMNWQLVWSERPYFDPSARPPLLQNLWSLAVEEQFYLIWPLLFAAGMRFLRLKGLLIATLVAALGSALLMAGLYEPGSDPTRLYYGTDTRAAGLLLGVALALVWSPAQTSAATNRAAGRAFDIVGMLGLGVLAFCYTQIYDYLPMLYQGGFLIVSLATLAVIMATTHGQARLVPALLSWQPLRWIGVRSYGIYLWHWPIIVFAGVPDYTTPAGMAMLALLVGVVFVLAELSYRFVELPIRRGELANVWQSLGSTLELLLSRRRTRTLTSKRQTTTMLSLLLVTTACASTGSVPMPGTAAASTSVASVTTAAPAPTAARMQTVVALPPDAATAAPPAETPIATDVPATSAPEPTVAATEPAAPAVQPFDQELAARLQQVLDATVADGYIPGTVVSVSIPGQEVWVGTSGVSNRAKGTPITADTRMRIASISKMFTAATVLRLVEEGKIELDAPIETYLPGLLPNGEITTVRELLQHRTGLYDFLEDRNYVNQAYRDPNRVFAPSELVDYALKFPAAFKPGAKNAWDYSSTNFVILGMLVEQVSGATMASEVRRLILEPLGMNSTYFDSQEQVEGTLSQGYSRTTNQTAVAMSFGFATANIVSTQADLQRFAAALFGNTLLKPETFAAMTTFVSGKGQYNMPELEYGLGVMRTRLPVGAGPDGERNPEESRVVGHIGGFGGFRSALWHAPESGVTITLGVNQASTDPNILATKLLNTVLTYLGR